jgi:tRNA A-37 threonylcarbamoyl transferase component Bud32
VLKLPPFSPDQNALTHIDVHTNERTRPPTAFISAAKVSRATFVQPPQHRAHNVQYIDGTETYLAADSFNVKAYPNISTLRLNFQNSTYASNLNDVVHAARKDSSSLLHLKQLEVVRLDLHHSILLPIASSLFLLEVLTMGGVSLCNDTNETLTFNASHWPKLRAFKIEFTTCAQLHIHLSCQNNIVPDVFVEHNPYLVSVSLTAPPNCVLPKLILSNNPRLKTFYPDIPRCEILDISNTSLRYNARYCSVSGNHNFYARSLQGDAPKSFSNDNLHSLLRACLVTFTTDLSNNPKFATNLTLLNSALGVPILDGSSEKRLHFLYAIDGLGVLSRQSTPNIYFHPSPVQCDVVPKQGLLMAGDLQKAQDLSTLVIENSYVYYQQIQCTCSPGFYESKGVCKSVPHPIPPWIVPTVVLLAIGAVQLIWYGMVQSERLTVADTKRQQAEAELEKCWQVAGTDLQLGDCVAQGQYGQIFKAAYAYQLCIKLLKKQVYTVAHVGEFQREVKFLKQNRHPNLVKFFGAGRLPPSTTNPGGQFLMLEYTAHGSLLDYYQAHKRDIVGQRHGFLMDIARGLTFIHSLGSMHRDLKTANVLVFYEQDTFVVKITDFGTVKLKEIQHQNAHFEIVGTLQYMAPEVMRGDYQTQAVDLFSLGVIFWELACLKEPNLLIQCSKLRGSELINMSELLEHGQRLELGADVSCPRWYRDVIQSCFLYDPGSRPTAAEVYDVLSQYSL